MSADIYVSGPGCCDAHVHNITHNLAPMFRAAGVNWRDWSTWGDAEPTKVIDVLPSVVLAWSRMKADPDEFKQYDPPNGWGDYNAAVRFLEGLMRDMAVHPDGTVTVSL